MPGQPPEKVFLFFSEILSMDVLDSQRCFVGTVSDVSIKPGAVYPQADEIILKRGGLGGSCCSLPWSAVASFDDDIILRAPSAQAPFSEQPKEHELLLKRDILDQQVVDTYNHKVRRVNDIHLLRADRDLIVAHVDIGLRGLVRRMGWESLVDFVLRRIAPRSAYLRQEELVGWKFVQPVAVNPASMTMKLSVSEKQLSSIPAADLGDILSTLNPSQRQALFRVLDLKAKARLFESLESDDRTALLQDLDKKEAADIIREMSPDEATDLLDRLPGPAAQNILALMESAAARKLSTLLGYSGDSAGGLMTTEFISIPELATVGEALEKARAWPIEKEFASALCVVDEKNRLRGITTLRRLLAEDPKTPVLRTLFPKVLRVHLSDSVKELSYIMERYKVHAVPVTDENNMLHGIVTVDDVLGRVVAMAWRRAKRTKGA